jgi:hypothetical protein
VFSCPFDLPWLSPEYEGYIPCSYNVGHISQNSLIERTSNMIGSKGKCQTIPHEDVSCTSLRPSHSVSLGGLSTPPSAVPHPLRMYILCRVPVHGHKRLCHSLPLVQGLYCASYTRVSADLVLKLMRLEFPTRATLNCLVRFNSRQRSSAINQGGLYLGVGGQPYMV